jgi:hypothetical protein
MPCGNAAYSRASSRSTKAASTGVPLGVADVCGYNFKPRKLISVHLGERQIFDLLVKWLTHQFYIFRYSAGAEDVAMTEQRIPDWLRTDLLIIVVAITIIGVVWIAP